MSVVILHDYQRQSTSNTINSEVFYLCTEKNLPLPLDPENRSHPKTQLRDFFCGCLCFELLRLRRIQMSIFSALYFLFLYESSSVTIFKRRLSPSSRQRFKSCLSDSPVISKQMVGDLRCLLSVAIIGHQFHYQLWLAITKFYYPSIYNRPT